MRRPLVCGARRAAVIGALGAGRSRGQLTRALEQIATLPGTAALRREQIEFRSR